MHGTQGESSFSVHVHTQSLSILLNPIYLDQRIKKTKWHLNKYFRTMPK